MNIFRAFFLHEMRKPDSPTKAALSSIIGYAVSWLSVLSPPVKYRILSELVVDARFVDKECYDYLLDSFGGAQRKYLVLHRFRQRIRERYGERKGCSMDMTLNHLGGTPDRLVISLWESNATYRFRISDLIILTNKALVASSGLFSTPRHPYNPYTNLAFTWTSMFKIYVAVKHSSFAMPTLLQLFYDCDFNCKRLSSEHDSYLVSKVIDDFMKHGPIAEKKYHITSLLAEFLPSAGTLVLHPRFPSGLMVDDLSYILSDYLRFITARSNDDRRRLQRRVASSVSLFACRFPYWGRKTRVVPEEEPLSLSIASPFLDLRSTTRERVPNKWVDIECHRLYTEATRVKDRHKKRRKRLLKRTL
jgi:hypothetical protein